MKRPTSAPKTSQQGVVLFITLVVLVALALGALAMFRGSLGATLVATNVVYRQAALNLADNGVQLATAALLARAQAGQINNDQTAAGYYSSVAENPDNEPNFADPAAWNCAADAICPTATQLCVGDAACMGNATGLTVYYKIHRLCTQADTPYNGKHPVTNKDNTCSFVVRTGGAAKGGSLAVGASQFTGNPAIYFRITTRVDGPRNTRSVTQTIVGVQT